MKYYFIKLFISLVCVVKLCNFYLYYITLPYLTCVLQVVADHFQYSCFLGLLASVTDGSWPCVVS